MASKSVSKRTIRWKTKDGQERTGQRWQARYRDETGREHAKLFKRKVDATTWLDEVTASMVTGTSRGRGGARRRGAAGQPVTMA